jgi:hypothetical protein
MSYLPYQQALLTNRIFSEIVHSFPGLIHTFCVQTSSLVFNALIEVVGPFKLHPISMSYLYEVFERLLSLWMGIWLHIHIITTTDTYRDL